MRVLRQRLPALAATLVAVSFITFMMTSLLPGDPAAQILGPAGVSPEAVEQVREDLRLDRPLLVRYVYWLGDVVRGDLGRSYITRQPVLEAILERLPVSLQIGGMAIGIALAGAIPLGMLSAYRAGTRLDRSITSVSFGLISVPNFMMAILLIYLMAVQFGLFPATGWVRFSQDPIRNLQAAILPALSLAMSELAVYTRLLRTDMISTLQQDFVTLARAKGLTTRHILIRHTLRPSSFSLMTVVGLQVGALIGGSVIVEEIFALPGVGRLLFQSIGQRDLMMVQGVVLFIAFAYVIVNFTVDMLYRYLDPRIRRGATAS